MRKMYLTRERKKELNDKYLIVILFISFLLLFFINSVDAQNLKSSQSATGSVKFDLGNSISTNNIIDIPVSITSVDSVTSFDFEMKFDELKLKFDSILNKTTYLDDFSFFNTSDRTLRFTTTTLHNENIEKNKTLLFVRFDKLGSSIDTVDFNSVKAYINGNPANIVLTKLITTGIDCKNAISDINIYPNPTSDILNVIVLEKATIQLIDINGNVIIEREANANQNQIINIANLANGIYLIRVFTDKLVTNKKMIISK